MPSCPQDGDDALRKDGEALILVTGPLFAGKREYVRATWKLTEQELMEKAVWDVQRLAAETEDLPALADALAEREFVIATEVGGGVVPMDAEERRSREAAGRLSCLLAERAEVVVRVCCGLPQLLKGELPC